MPDHWENHADFPVGDWQYEVANGDTRLGYAEWRAHQIEAVGTIGCPDCREDLLMIDGVACANCGWVYHPEQEDG